MANVQLWSTTAATNASADSDINWAEGQTPSSVNDSARQMMASLAAYHKDTNGTITAGGSANALTVTTNSSHTSLTNGLKVRFVTASANTSTATLAVDGLTAKNLKKQGGTALASGDLVSGAIYEAMYLSSPDEFRLIGGPHRAVDVPVTAITGISGSEVQTILEALAASVVPAGSLTPYAGSSAPTGWLFCYGQNVNRTTYANLFTAIGTTYGVGDGSTTFTLPDLRGRTLFGKDDMGGSAASRLSALYFGGTPTSLGAVGGEESHVITSSQLPAHTHTASATDSGHTHSVKYNTSSSYGTGAVSGVTSVSSAGNQTGTAAALSGTANISVTVDSAGSSSAMGLIPPAIILNYIIKT